MKRVAVLLFGLVAALALAEGLLRLFWRPPVTTSGWSASMSVPGLEENQMGFRGHPIEYAESTFVIVLVGDSQVEADHLAWGWMPECRLEAHLDSLVAADVEVVSIGSPGYGQDQQLLALERYFETYRADMVIIWETPANDLWNNTFPTHWPANGWVKPTFWLEDGMLRGPTEGMGDTLPSPPLRLLQVLRAAMPPADRDGEWEARLPEPYAPVTSAPGPTLPDWQQRWDTNLGMMRDENLATEKSHLAIYLTPRSDRMQYSLDLTRLLLGRIDSLCCANGASLVLFAMAGPPDPSCDTDYAVFGLNGMYYQVSRRQYQENVECYNEGFTFFQIPVAIEDWRMGPADSHLNEHATDLMMGDLALLVAPLVEPPRKEP